MQRPKDHGASTASVSAADLPDDFDVNTIITANSAKQLYRVAVGPLTVSPPYILQICTSLWTPYGYQVHINFVPADMGIEIVAKVKVPIVGEVTIAKVKGNLKQGVVLHIKYSDLVKGDVGVKLDGSSVVLYWELSALGVELNDKLGLFTL